MKQGDIVILEFPFSNIADKKLRPALILSNTRYNQRSNVLLAGIYGKKQPFSISLTASDLREGRIRKTSYVSLQNIFSADKQLVRHTVSALAAEKLKEVVRELQKCI